MSQKNNAEKIVITKRTCDEPMARSVNNPRLKSRACGSKPWLTSQSAKSTTLRENI